MIKKKNIIYLLVFIFLFFGLMFYNNKKEVKSNEGVREGVVNIYHFWASGCSYCALQEEWIKEIEEKEKEKIIFLKFEVSKNYILFVDLLEKFNVPKNMRGSVPITFIGDKYFIGFNNSIKEKMEAKIKECIEKNNCEEPANKQD